MSCETSPRAGARAAPPASRPPKDSGERPGGRGPRAGRGHWRLAGPTCLVRAVLAPVPAGPRGPPTQSRSHQGRRVVHARPAAGGAAPGRAAARAPALPRSRRRQEAAEPVPFHGGRPAPRPARLRSARLGSRLGCARRARLAGLGGVAPGSRSGRAVVCSAGLRSGSPVPAGRRRWAPLSSLEAGRAGRPSREGRGEGRGRAERVWLKWREGVGCGTRTLAATA